MSHTPLQEPEADLSDYQRTEALNEDVQQDLPILASSANHSSNPSGTDGFAIDRKSKIVYETTNISGNACVHMGNVTQIFALSSVDPRQLDEQELVLELQNVWRTFELKQFKKGQKIDRRKVFPLIEDVFSGPCSPASTDGGVRLDLQADPLSAALLEENLLNLASGQPSGEMYGTSWSQMPSPEVPETVPSEPAQLFPPESLVITGERHQSRMKDSMPEEADIMQGGMTSLYSSNSDQSELRYTSPNRERWYGPGNSSMSSTLQDQDTPNIDNASNIEVAWQFTAKYLIRNGKKFFVPGRVFAVLWSEQIGHPNSKSSRVYEYRPKLNLNVTSGPYNTDIFSHIRRFVVVRNRHGYCWCLSISTYGGRGLLKPGLSEGEIKAHTIIHDSRKKAMRLKGEPDMVYRPIAIEMVEGETLVQASRIHLAKPYSVEWNVKAMDVGMVCRQDIEALLGCVRKELQV